MGLSLAQPSGLHSLVRRIARGSLVGDFHQAGGKHGDAHLEGPVVAGIWIWSAGDDAVWVRLIGEDRSVVHDQPGTTRDAIDTVVETELGELRFIDTAGMRRKARIDEDTEYYSFVRALRAIDGADVALLVIDCTVGVTHQDQRLAERVDAAGCPVVVILNKWELLDVEDREMLVDQVASYLYLQIRAGVDAVQLFDTWVGCLSVADFRRYVLPHTRRLIQAIKEGSGGRVPVIYFGTGNSHLLADVVGAGPDVLAVDWRVPLGETWQALGCPSIQGNLDPIVLCADRKTVAEQAQAVLDQAAGRNGHIFNLGHGIIPETPVDNVKFLVDFVHERSAGGA